MGNINPDENEFLESLFDAIPFGVYVTDIATYDLIFINKTMKSKGFQAQGKCHQVIYQENSPCHFCPIKSLLTADMKPSGQCKVYEIFNESDDHWYQLQDKCIAWPDGRIAKYSIAVDISGLKETQNQLAEAHAELALKNRQLEKAAITDALTQLYNRIKLDSTFGEELKRASRLNTPFSIIILDVDFFKAVNDTYGHQTGDYVLRSIAGVLKSRVREIDVLGRWGGEEFLIICPGSELEGALALAEELRKGIEQFPFKETGKQTASFGVTEFRAGDSESMMVARADKALYQAKEEGRNLVKCL